MCSFLSGFWFTAVTYSDEGAKCRIVPSRDIIIDANENVVQSFVVEEKHSMVQPPARDFWFCSWPLFDSPGNKKKKKEIVEEKRPVHAISYRTAVHGGGRGLLDLSAFGFRFLPWTSSDPIRSKRWWYQL